MLASLNVCLALLHHFTKLDHMVFIFFQKSFNELVHLLNPLAQL
ncbi:MAG: hypothetical protein WCG25_00870 [bacterium]